MCDRVTSESRACFSPSIPIEGGIGAGLQYPAYFKDAKGNNHSVFGSGNPLHYLKQGPKGLLPDIIQHGRTAGMPLYVRCPICQKEFKQKTTLLQHGCIHIESRPYPCPECGKRFRQQSHLTQHLRIHTNEKPYGCIYCPRFFRQRTILNQVHNFARISISKNRFRNDGKIILSAFHIHSTYEFIPAKNRTNAANVARISVKRQF